MGCEGSECFGLFWVFRVFRLLVAFRVWDLGPRVRSGLRVWWGSVDVAAFAV